MFIYIKRKFDSNPSLLHFTRSMISYRHSKKLEQVRQQSAMAWPIPGLHDLSYWRPKCKYFKCDGLNNHLNTYVCTYTKYVYLYMYTHTLTYMYTYIRWEPDETTYGLAYNIYIVYTHKCIICVDYMCVCM